MFPLKILNFSLAPWVKKVVWWGYWKPNNLYPWSKVEWDPIFPLIVQFKLRNYRLVWNEIICDILCSLFKCAVWMLSILCKNLSPNYAPFTPSYESQNLCAVIGHKDFQWGWAKVESFFLTFDTPRAHHVSFLVLIWLTIKIKVFM